METPSSHEITELLRAWSAGVPEAFEKLMPLVETELSRQAKRYLRRERPGHLLQTKALINEAYFKLINLNQVDWKDRAHFFAFSATIMRRILIDMFRKPHNKAQQVELDEAMGISAEGNPDLIALDDALEALAKIDPRKSRVVELKFFGGLTTEEIAEVLKLSPRTIKSEWKTAKAWLYHELNKS